MLLLVERRVSVLAWPISTAQQALKKEKKNQVRQSIIPNVRAVLPHPALGTKRTYIEIKPVMLGVKKIINYKGGIFHGALTHGKFQKKKKKSYCDPYIRSNLRSNLIGTRIHFEF